MYVKKSDTQDNIYACAHTHREHRSVQRILGKAHQNLAIAVL